MKDFQEEYYDTYHYPEQHDWKRITLLLKLLKKNNAGTNFLDIGCNNGEVSVKFKEAGYTVLGLDNSTTALEQAKKRGINVKKVNFLEETKPSQFKTLPFPDNSFDIVFCGETLEHILYPQHIVKEAHRVLKVGGFFLVTVPNVSSLGNAVLILAGRLPAHACVFDGPHVRDFCHRDLKRLLKQFPRIELYGDKITLPIGKDTRVTIPRIYHAWCDYCIAFCRK